MHRHVPEPAGVRRPVGVTDEDVRLDGRELGSHLGQRRQDGRVDQDDPVLPVVHDVGQLLGEQPQVQGVQDGAHRRHGEVGLEVLLGVPQERPDPVALHDSQ